MHGEKRDITHKQNNLASKVKGTGVENLLTLHSLECTLEFLGRPFPFPVEFLCS